MDLEHSGIAEVAILSLDATPESHCMEKVEEMMYMSPKVHMESIQTCPESLKANVPQTTIGTCTTMHEQVAFKGTAAPDPRALPEKQLEPKVPQFEPSTKDGTVDLEVLEESRCQRDIKHLVRT